MRDLKRACLLAVALWTLLHVAITVSTLGASSLPALHLAGLVVVVAAITVAVRPLLGADEPPPGRTTTALLVLSVPVVGLLVSLPLDGAELPGYANWWSGAVCPVIAALVVRRRVLAGAAAAVLETVVIVGTVLHESWPRQDWLTIALLEVSPVLWLAGSLGVATVFRRTERTVSALQSRADAARLQEQRAAAREELASARRRELQGLVGPTLRRLAAGDGSQALDRDGTRQLEAHLRDLLRARALVDLWIRAAAAGARARGAVVTLVDDRQRGADDVLPARVRPLVLAALGVVTAGALTARLAPDGELATVVLELPDPPEDGAPPPPGVLAELRDRLVAAADGQLLLALDVDDDTLVAEARLPDHVLVPEGVST